MKKINTILIRNFISMIVLLMVIAPFVSFSASLVPCNNNTKAIIENGVTIPAVPCDFNAFMKLINGGITFILRTMVLPIAAIMFAYAGFLMVTSGGSTEARGKAKNIFSNTVLGLVIAVAAWLIVKTILSILGFDGAWIFDKF